MAVIDFQEALRARRASIPNPPLSYLVPLWLADRRSNNLSVRGVETYKDVFLRFLSFAGDIRLYDLTTDLIKAYKRDMMQRVDASTTRLALTVIRAFCAWAIAERYLPENPALRVTHPKVTPPNPDPLTSEQVDHLLAALDAPSRSHKACWRRNRRAVYLMLYAGLRLAEVAGLEWRDIDLKRRMITIRREIAKGGKPRVVPICDELLSELQQAPHRNPHWAVVDRGETRAGQGVPMGIKSLARLFERWLPRRGIVIHAHQLRKTFATELYVRGEDIVTIQRLLGHSDPKTTVRYIGACSDKEQRAVGQLQFRGE